MVVISKSEAFSLQKDGIYDSNVSSDNSLSLDSSARVTIMTKGGYEISCIGQTPSINITGLPRAFSPRNDV